MSIFNHFLLFNDAYINVHLIIGISHSLLYIIEGFILLEKKIPFNLDQNKALFVDLDPIDRVFLKFPKILFL